MQITALQNMLAFLSCLGLTSGIFVVYGFVQVRKDIRAKRFWQALLGGIGIAWALLMVFLTVAAVRALSGLS